MAEYKNIIDDIINKDTHEYIYIYIYIRVIDSQHCPAQWRLARQALFADLLQDLEKPGLVIPIGLRLLSILGICGFLMASNGIRCGRVADSSQHP